MVCLGCHALAVGSICDRCRRSIRLAPEKVLGDGLRLVSAFQHEGAARTLMHHLKYRGVTVYADLVAEVIAPSIPQLPLVPIPRAHSRRIRFGVDPARVIAHRLAARIGSPVVSGLRAHPHTPRRAGGDHRRKVPVFAVRGDLPTQVILVDDVVTTGATMLAAASSLAWRRANIGVCANVADVSSLSAQ